MTFFAEKLGLPSDPMQYNYLKQGGVSQVKGVVDKTDGLHVQVGDLTRAIRGREYLPNPRPIKIS